MNLMQLKCTTWGYACRKIGPVQKKFTGELLMQDWCSHFLTYSFSYNCYTCIRLRLFSNVFGTQAIYINVWYVWYLANTTFVLNNNNVVKYIHLIGCMTQTSCGKKIAKDQWTKLISRRSNLMKIGLFNHVRQDINHSNCYHCTLFFYWCCHFVEFADSSYIRRFPLFI